MRSRRGGRNRDRKQERFSRTSPLLEQGDTAAQPPAVSVLEGDNVDERRLVVVSDPWFVQFADLTGCDIDDCPEVAVPEAWELVDLDTGDEQPARFCEEHQLAWLRRPRPVAPAVG